MKPRIALALSGGGFRASIFHLGVLRRLAESGWLSRVDVISTVSGGSIIGAFLALHWQDLLRAEGDKRAFMRFIVEPFLGRVTQNNFLAQWLKGAWRWPLGKLADKTFTRTQAAAALFDANFFDGKSCLDLPEHPLLVLNATSLQSMRSWRFTRNGLGDSRIGHAIWAGHPLSLGTCVGASAAFPPVFPPARIRRSDYTFSGPLYGESDLPHFAIIPLTDGGVYDNNGLEALIKPVSVPGVQERLETADFLVVSDGGAVPQYHFSSSCLPGIGDAFLLYRVDEIAREQVTALRSRSLVSEFISRKRQGVFVSLKSEVAKIGETPFTEYCKHVSTRYLIPREVLSLIRGFSDLEAMALMYHAYLMTDAFLWCYRETFAAEYQVAEKPSPEWLVEFSPTTARDWLAALRDSSSSLRWR